MGTVAKKPRLGWGLLTRRLCLCPTWRGWLVLLALGAMLGVGAVRGVYPFLAVNAPLPGGTLVVEGWGPDYVLARARAELERRHGDKLFVTGGPLEKGAPLSEYKTFAEMGVATLAAMGLSTNRLQAMPAPPVRHDRTYASAVALKTWWRGHGGLPAEVNIITVGPHARRTRLLFEKALSPEIRVGIMAVESQDYDPQRWWTTSPGVRTVIGEAIAYAYARIFFRAPAA